MFGSQKIMTIFCMVATKSVCGPLNLELKQVCDFLNMETDNEKKFNAKMPIYSDWRIY